MGPRKRGPTQQPQKQRIWLPPQTISFSSAKIQFTLDRYKNNPVITLIEGLQKLRRGDIKQQDIPTMSVVPVPYGDAVKYYTMDNRRLWLFRELGRQVQVIVEEPSEEFCFHLTSLQCEETVCIVDSVEETLEFRASSSFFSEVLRWSIANIKDDNFYRDKMRVIPTRFENLKAYFAYFLWPLVEDTKAGICKSLQQVEQGRRRSSLRCTVYELETPQAKVQLSLYDLKKFLVVADMTYYNNIKSRVEWKHQKWDLVLMSTSLPMDFNDLQYKQECYTLGVITSSGGQSQWQYRNIPSFVRVTAFCPSTGQGRLVQTLTRSGRKWYLVVLGNLSTALRTWDALNPQLPFSTDRLQLVTETLYSPGENQNGSSDLHPEAGGSGKLAESIEHFCKSRELNESQTETVVKTAIALRYGQQPKVRLVKGPPGTGKTATLVTFLSIVTCLEYRTLVCANANRAVCEIAQRFVYLVNRMPNPEKSTQYQPFFSTYDCEGTCHRLRLGDIILVGNDERLEVESDLSMVYLPLRVRRLSDAILETWSWEPVLQSVLKLLGHPDQAEYQFRRNNPRIFEHVNKMEYRRSYVTYFKESLVTWGSQLILSGYILRRNLPKKLLSRAMSSYIGLVCAAVADVLESLPTDLDIVDDENIETWFTFLKKPVHEITSTTLYRTLDVDDVREHYDLRKKLAKLLAILSCSFNKRITTLLAKFNKGNLEDMCLQHARIVFCTISSAGRQSVQTSGPFTSLVIDEASQLVEAETAIATQLPGVRQALLVGDEKQLPATVVSMVARDCGYSRSLFERLQVVGHPHQLLKIQYRMHSEISLFPNRKFYESALEDGRNVTSDMYIKPYQKQYGPYCFINVAEGKEEKGNNDSSNRNWFEVEVLFFLLQKLQSVCLAHGIPSTSVGIITPYASQVDALSTRLSKHESLQLRFPNLRVEIKTVDGFQGGERDVILFSTVRANPEGRIGFLTDNRRLNVAITRARYCLWIVGHARTLGATRDGVWAQVLNDARSRNCLIDAKDDEPMRMCYQHLQGFGNPQYNNDGIGESSKKVRIS